jgi:hypothetical protein
MPEIMIEQGYKRFHLKWELIHKDKMVERYKITPPANPDKYLIIENNRPFIREIKGLKKRRIDWKQVEGPTKSERTLQMIIDQIENPTKPKKYTSPSTLPRSVPNPKKKDKPGGPTLGERRGL